MREKSRYKSVWMVCGGCGVGMGTKKYQLLKAHFA